jgi:oligoribonuclease NrnB/cAMP/cGMP phosphodiesterase (DHH superfamily)
VAELAAKANEGELSAGDREEYEAYIDANNLLALLQAEARYRLAQNLGRGREDKAIYRQSSNTRFGIHEKCVVLPVTRTRPLSIAVAAMIRSVSARGCPI